LEGKSIEDFIDSLGIRLPPHEKFLKLSETFKINPIREKERSILNYERGILLYALIAKYRPKTVLEIGRAQGYSTMCMAWAMSENDIDGKIFSVDPNPIDMPRKMLVDFDESKPASVIEMSTMDLWKTYAKSEWIEKIAPIVSYSDEILEYDIPKIDFCYIDGHHTKDAVICDFHVFLCKASRSFLCLFDDYTDPSEVKDAIDAEILPHCEMQFIDTTLKDSVKKLFGVDKFNRTRMCLVESSSFKAPLEDIYQKDHSLKQIMSYRKLRKRWNNRKKLNRFIPFLGKIKIKDLLASQHD
jgi:hypothetical protein